MSDTNRSALVTALIERPERLVSDTRCSAISYNPNHRKDTTMNTKLGVADRAAAIAKARDAGLGSRGV